MGLGAALTIISLLPTLKTARFFLDKKTLLIIMGINLAMGFTISGINNAAHIGGMIMGAVLATAWYIGQKIQRPSMINLSALILTACGLWLIYEYSLILVQGVLPLWQELVQMMLKSIQSV